MQRRVPLRTTNAKKDPGIRYEFPCDAERRTTWLNNISRQGTAGKGARWEPSDRSLVCSLHFKDEDYKNTTKYKVLLPNAVPTVFPHYPAYMRRDISPKVRKQPQRNSLPSAPVEVEDVESSGGANRNGGGHSELKSSNTDTDVNVETVMTTSGPVSSLVDVASQTDFDLRCIIESMKKTTHRLEMKISSLKQAL